ncbi:MAG TPA: Wzz/FepE/Etk N-terminal domain-containing protein [Gammaproteobacteria bacterium]|nr:Wzz/FepE/Etk N-terminal domain-containing protein [Gammaproteobacteria bacterium]
MDQRNPTISAISDFSRRELAVDEIDLVDLAVVLVRHWRLMLAVFFLTTVVGAAVVWLQDAKYQYSTIIVLGQRADGELLDSPEAVQAAIENVFLPAAAESADKTTRQLAVNVRVELPKASSAVVLKVAASKDKAGDINQLFSSISGPLIADHSQRFERLADPLNRQVARQEAVLAALSQDIVKLQAELPSTGQEARILLLDQIVRLQESHRLGQQELSQLQADIARTTPTRISGVPQRALSEAGASPLLIVALAAVLGSIFAVFSAFFAEFAASVRMRLQVGRLVGRQEA